MKHVGLKSSTIRRLALAAITGLVLSGTALAQQSVTSEKGIRRALVVCGLPGDDDHRTLYAGAVEKIVKALVELQPERNVVLVSKDINMRIKARALGLPAEDYFNDKTLDDGDLLYTGTLQLPADFWDKHGKTFADPDGYRVVLQNAAWPA